MSAGLEAELGAGLGILRLIASGALAQRGWKLLYVCCCSAGLVAAGDAGEDEPQEGAEDLWVKDKAGLLQLCVQRKGRSELLFHKPLKAGT
jgi:hypothetical protein